MNLDRIALVTHDGKPRARELRADLQRWLEGRGANIVDEGPSLVISLGGDGTMLRAAQLAHAADAPLLGVNLGALGYLTEVDAGSELDALGRIASGDFELEERMMLSCTAGDSTFVGLNEVLVERSSRQRLVHLTVTVGGQTLGAFNADGVIVATPTGSTAYALSAGGPILAPLTPAIVIVPVSPHMIPSRPFVVAADEMIQIVVPEDQDASLSLDGAIGCELGPGSKVGVRKHPRPLRLVRLGGPGFMSRLRTKLGLHP